MEKKSSITNILNMANGQITVIGRDLCAISAHKVESLIDYSFEGAMTILAKAREEGRYVNVIADESKIKTLILMDNGKVYPSTFNLPTLSKRIYEATSLDLENK